MLDKRLTFLGAAIIATGLCAQESTGTVVGTVKEPGGRPSARATVVIAGEAILGSRTLATDENGNLRIQLLPPGNYTLTVSKLGFISSRATFRVSAGQVLRQDFALRTTDVAQTTVEIAAVAAAVDKTQTTTSNNFSVEKLGDLPLGLTTYAALSLSPGVQGPTGFPVVRGGLGGETAVMVDGISIKDPSVRQVRNFEYVMGDMTEDISVIQSPLNAKYGNNSGGAIAITSTSGKNRFEGSIRANLEVPAWNTLVSGHSNRLGTTTIANPGEIDTDQMGKEYIISLFGPIIPNHLTFSYSGNFIPTEYAVYAATNISLSSTRFLPNFPGYEGPKNAYMYDNTPNNTKRAGGFRASVTNQYKLFWLINQDHQVEAMYSLNDFGPYYQGWGTLDTLASQSSIREFKSVNYRGIIGSNGVIEAKWGQRVNEINFANGPGNPIAVFYYQNNPAITSVLDNRKGGWWTNGYSGSDTVIRNSETAGINYNWFNGIHNVDIGYERLKDIVLEPPAFGPSGKRFYSPGRREDGQFIVWNYVGSDVQTGTGQVANGVAGLTYETVRGSQGYIPEMYASDYEPGDPTPEYTTDSFYVNDLWTINQNWNVMLGLRYDSWKAEGINGEFINSSAISPRFEVKYDLLGNNQHLLSASYAHFRSTIGMGTLGINYAQQPGQKTYRYFWNNGNGTPSAPEWVTLEEVQDSEKYGFLYALTDSSLLYEVDPKIKPTNTIEYAVSYRRAFENGGYFRITGIVRTFQDIWNTKGTPTPVITNPMTNGYGGYLQQLAVNPDAKRDHKGIEMEWSYPLYKSANQSLLFEGNWTINRTTGTNPYREGYYDFTTEVYRLDLYKALEIPEDDYAPYGEFRFSNHNVIKAWLTWSLGERGGIRNTFSLLARYTHGGPFNLNVTKNLNQADPAYLDYWERTPAGTISSVGISSSYRHYINGRGRFTDNDHYDADFAWNFTIPIKGRLHFFAEFHAYSIFNVVMPWGDNNGLDSPVSIRVPAAAGAWTHDYTGAFKVDQFDRFGLVNANRLLGERTYDFSCGIRF
jgi:hypothetical protein